MYYNNVQSFVFYGTIQLNILLQLILLSIQKKNFIANIL